MQLSIEPAKWVQLLSLQNGCSFEMLEKEKSRKLLGLQDSFCALQDGLEPTTP